MWGMPLIRKRQDTALVERAFRYFDRENSKSLVRKIEFIAQHGGEDTLSVDMDGIWFLYPYGVSNPENNSIQFSFSSTVTDTAKDVGWVSLSSGNINPIGSLGIDDPSVVFVRADTHRDTFNITYKSWFRELDETPEKGYKIRLLPDTITTSVGRTIRISRGEIKEETQGSKTLIITEIKLLLV